MLGEGVPTDAVRSQPATDQNGIFRDAATDNDDSAADIPRVERDCVVRTDYIPIGDRPTGMEDWLEDLPRSYKLDSHTVTGKSAIGLGWAEKTPPALDHSVQSHRTGICFNNESEEMRSECVDVLQQYLGANEVVHEARHQRNGFHTDLVFAVFDDDGMRKRSELLTTHDPLHDPFERFQVWWYLYERGPMPYNTAVEDGCYVSASKNEKQIDWLLDAGYVARTRSNNVVGVRPPRLASLHAVELKLRDWETALEQAARANKCDTDDQYLQHKPIRAQDRYGYADYRWVALDGGAISAAVESEQTFRQEGVGLVGVAEGGTVVEHIPAVHDPRERYTRDRAYIESQLWTRLGGESNSDVPDPSPVTGDSSRRTEEMRNGEQASLSSIFR